MYENFLKFSSWILILPCKSQLQLTAKLEAFLFKLHHQSAEKGKL